MSYKVRRGLEWGTALLVGAGVTVGLAIVVGGTPGRILNGVGGLAWIAGAALLGLALRSTPRAGRCFFVVAALALSLVWISRSNDLTMTVLGFGAGGAIIGSIVPAHRTGWARLLPAVWLPCHIAVAVMQLLVEGGDRLRNAPPPTAMLVPLSMVLAAWAGGVAVDRLVDARRGRATAGVSKAAG